MSKKLKRPTLPLKVKIITYIEENPECLLSEISKYMARHGGRYGQGSAQDLEISVLSCPEAGKFQNFLSCPNQSCPKTGICPVLRGEISIFSVLVLSSPVLGNSVFCE